MTDQTIISLAQQYVDRSNKHVLEEIFPLFDPEVTYRSSQFGAFKGIDAIKEMMTGFFTRYTDVHWLVDDYTPETDDTVVFDFEMRATDKDTGQKVERRGRERIRFSEAGLIVHVDVEVVS